jgi:hypothetical protein
MTDHRASFDAVISFSNGGDLTAHGFALDVRGAAVLLHTGDDARFGSPAYAEGRHFLTRRGPSPGCPSNRPTHRGRRGSRYILAKPGWIS